MCYELYKLGIEMDEKLVITCECAPNIALIKYWGKSDDDLIIPLNSSISITLDYRVLNSRTTVELIKKNDLSNLGAKIYIDLNEASEEFFENDSNVPVKELINRKRLLKMLHKVRSNCGLDDALSYDIRISSRNNFPTACGLASSASGLACLAYCLSKIFKYQGNTAELARIGSGSACRSIFGGFVCWHAGDGTSSTSISTQLFPSSHWPELNVLILVLEDQKKSISSTDGMKDSVRTSDLLKDRVRLVEEKRLSEMQEAIKKKDFGALACLTMRDSNTFHAVCLDTYPPLFYLNDKSKTIIRFVDEFNKMNKENSSSTTPTLAYTFDAGPNAFLLVEDTHLVQCLYLIGQVFYNGELTDSLISVDSDLREKLKSYQCPDMSKWREMFKRANFISKQVVKTVIHSKVGDDIPCTNSLSD